MKKFLKILIVFAILITTGNLIKNAFAQTPVEEASEVTINGTIVCFNQSTFPSDITVRYRKTSIHFLGQDTTPDLQETGNTDTYAFGPVQHSCENNYTFDLATQVTKNNNQGNGYYQIYTYQFENDRKPNQPLGFYKIFYYNSGVVTELQPVPQYDIQFDTYISPLPIPYNLTGLYNNDAGYTQMKYSFYDINDNFLITRNFDLAPISGTELSFSHNIYSPPAGVNYWYAELIDEQGNSSKPYSPVLAELETISFVLQSSINQGPPEIDDIDLSQYDCDPSLITVDSFGSLADYIGCALHHVIFNILFVPVADLSLFMADSWNWFKNESIPLAYFFRPIEIYNNVELPENYVIDIEPFKYSSNQFVSSEYKLELIDLANPSFGQGFEQLMDRGVERYIRIGAWFSAFLLVFLYALRKFL